jgi:hypothetical protein
MGGVIDEYRQLEVALRSNDDVKVRRLKKMMMESKYGFDYLN